MRPLLLAMLCLAAASAWAQPSASSPPAAPESVPPPPLVSAPAATPAAPESAPAPPEPAKAARQEPPDTPSLPPPPLPGATGPALPPSERVQSYVDPGRYTSLSAGPGGYALVFTELVSGAVCGGLIGATREGGDRTFSGIMVGALTLGTVSTFYQYFVRVESNEGWLTATAATAGFITGFGVASEQGLSRSNRALLSLASTQAAIIGMLALTASRPGDVSSGDTWLMGVTSLYAFVFTGLVQASLDTPDKDTNATPTMLAPTLGLIAGALLAMPLELDPTDLAMITVIPIVVGLGTARAAERVREPDFGRLMLVTVGSAFLITSAFTLLSGDSTSETRSASRGSGLQAVPVPVVMTAGRGHGSLAAGPGLLMRF